MFYLTASKMHSHLAVASVIETVSPFSSTHNQQVTEAIPVKTPAPRTEVIQAPPEKKTEQATAIPDSALVGTTQNEAASAVATTLTYSFEKLASNLHTRANIFRSQNNLSAFSFDTRLATLATQRSQDMAAHDYFSHTSPDGCDLSCRFKKSDYMTLSWGENLAEYSNYEELSESNLAELFTNKWIESSEHRQNLLSKDFTTEGIGVAVKGKRIVVTVIFAKS
jgi:uncharacterized protein YkwD